MTSSIVFGMVSLATLGFAHTTSVRHATHSLSVARRDIGGAAAGGKVIFAGGCTGGFSVYTCEKPSAVIDILTVEDSDSNAFQIKSASAALSTPRGWPSTCAVGNKVAFLGGGVSGSRPHSRVLDVFDTVSNEMQTNSTALDAGRWGMTCVVAANALYFAGGKEISFWGKPSMTDELLKLSSVPETQAGGLRLSGNLSVARESTGGVALGSKRILFAGGWISAPMPGGPSAVVDAFDLASGKSYTWELPQKPGPNTYWIGAAPWSEELVFLADATMLYYVTVAVFNGTEAPKQVALPTEAAGGGIPLARMAQNGVRVGGAVCFYSASPSALVCYELESETWATHPCSAEHTAGAIVAIRNTVYVAGGVDAKGNPVATIDIFTFGSAVLV